MLCFGDAADAGRKVKITVGTRICFQTGVSIHFSG